MSIYYQIFIIALVISAVSLSHTPGEQRGHHPPMHGKKGDFPPMNGNMTHWRHGHRPGHGKNFPLMNQSGAFKQPHPQKPQSQPRSNQKSDRRRMSTKKKVFCIIGFVALFILAIFLLVKLYNRWYRNLQKKMYEQIKAMMIADGFTQQPLNQSLLTDDQLAFPKKEGVAQPINDDQTKSSLERNQYLFV